MTPEVGTLAAILADVGTYVTAAIGWMGQVVSTIVSTPLLLLGFIMAVSGFAVGLFHRIVRI